MEDQIFDVKSVVEYYDEFGFKAIPQDELMDFCVTRGNGELSFLDVWRRHFESVRVPYAITQHVDKYPDRKILRVILWKERRI